MPFPPAGARHFARANGELKHACNRKMCPPANGWRCARWRTPPTWHGPRESHRPRDRLSLTSPALITASCSAPLSSTSSCGAVLNLICVLVQCLQTGDWWTRTQPTRLPTFPCGGAGLLLVFVGSLSRRDRDRDVVVGPGAARGNRQVLTRRWTSPYLGATERFTALCGPCPRTARSLWGESGRWRRPRCATANAAGRLCRTSLFGVALWRAAHGGGRLLRTARSRRVRMSLVAWTRWPDLSLAPDAAHRLLLKGPAWSAEHFAEASAARRPRG